MGQQLYLSPGSYSWTCPAGVTSVDIQLIGAGADGISGANGAGGGGGAYIAATVSVSPGSSYAIVVGSRGANGGDTTWTVSTFIAGGAQGSTGGTVSGSGLPTNTSVGGVGGSGCSAGCDVCDDCFCDTYNSPYCCDPGDPGYPDCPNGTCQDCISYTCGSWHSTACDAGGGGGSSGSASGYSDGTSGSCDNGSTDNCGYCSGATCGGGSGGLVPAFPGGNGGDPGQPASDYGGGGGGGGYTGTSGYAQLDWASPVYNETGSGGVVCNSRNNYGCLSSGSATISVVTSKTATGGIVASGHPILYDRLKKYLKAYWALDESSGDAVDTLGNNNLTQSGTIGTTGGRVNTARAFDAASKYFTHSVNSDLATGNFAFTYAAWCNISAQHSLGQIVVEKLHPTYGNILELFLQNGTPRTFWLTTYDNPTGGGTAASTVSITNGGWHLVIAGLDYANGQVFISVDNETVVTSAASSTLSDVSTGTTFYVGGTGSSSTYWDGAIDEVGFWNTVLDVDDRAALWNNGTGTTYPFDGVYPPVGVLANGTATITTTDNVSVSGGDLSNGSATPTARYTASVSSGDLVAGSATTTATYTASVSSGIGASGSGTATVVYACSAASGDVVGGSAGSPHTYNESGSSGAVLGGSASLTSGTHTYNETATGGVKSAGAAKRIRFIYHPTPTSGVLANGSYIWTVKGTGGIKAGGQSSLQNSSWLGKITLTQHATLSLTAHKYKLGVVTLTQNGTLSLLGKATFRPTVGGTVLAGGSAHVTSKQTFHVAGGAKCAGQVQTNWIKFGSITLTETCTLNLIAHLIAAPRARGGIVANRSATVTSNQIVHVAGGSKCSGKATVSLNKHCVITLTQNGSLSLIPHVNHKAAITLTANATLNLIAKAVGHEKGKAGAKAAGNSSVLYAHPQSVGGGSKCSGSAKLTHGYTNKGTGGIAVNGVSLVCKKTTVSVGGGSVNNSHATIKETVTIKGQSGDKAAGTASVNSKEHKTPTGGIKCSGSATSTYKAAAKITLTQNCNLELTPYQFIGDAIRDYLLTNWQPMSLTQGDLPDVHIYPLRAPQACPKPAIIITLIAQDHHKVLRYQGSTGAGKAVARVQLDVLADDTSTLLAATKRTKTLVNGFRKGYWGSVRILQCTNWKEIDGDLFKAGGSQNLLRRRVLDFTVEYIESRPIFSSTVLGTTGDIETSIFNYLSTVAPVYRTAAPQGTRGPVILWSKADESDIYDLNELPSDPVMDFELVCRGDHHNQSVDLANKVRMRLDGLVGQLDDTWCGSVTMDAESQAYQLQTVGADNSYYSINQTYKFSIHDA